MGSGTSRPPPPPPPPPRRLLGSTGSSSSLNQGNLGILGVAPSLKLGPASSGTSASSRQQGASTGSRQQAPTQEPCTSTGAQRHRQEHNNRLEQLGPGSSWAPAAARGACNPPTRLGIDDNVFSQNHASLYQRHQRQLHAGRVAARVGHHACLPAGGGGREGAQGGARQKGSGRRI